MCCKNCNKDNFILKAKSSVDPFLTYYLCGNCGMVSMSHAFVNNNEIVPTPNETEGVNGLLTEKMMEDAIKVLTEEAVKQGIPLPNIGIATTMDLNRYDDTDDEEDNYDNDCYCDEDCDHCDMTCDDIEEDDDEEEDDWMIPVLSAMSKVFGEENSTIINDFLSNKETTKKKEEKEVTGKETVAIKDNKEERKDYVILEKGGKRWTSVRNATKADLTKAMNEIDYPSFTVAETLPVSIHTKSRTIYEAI